MKHMLKSGLERVRYDSENISNKFAAFSDKSCAALKAIHPACSDD